MKLLAICGSTRQDSYNLALLTAMQHQCPHDASVSIYRDIEQIPIFNQDAAEDNTPQPVDELLSAIRESDGLIISTPEYAHGIPGGIKNALDWLVSSDAVVLKPIVVTSVSTSNLGGIRSQAPLVLVLSAMNANIIVEGSMNVPYAKSKFDNKYHLTDELTKKAIEVMFLALKRSIENT